MYAGKDRATEQLTLEDFSDWFVRACGYACPIGAPPTRHMHFPYGCPPLDICAPLCVA